MSGKLDGGVISSDQISLIAFAATAGFMIAVFIIVVYIDFAHLKKKYNSLIKECKKNKALSNDEQPSTDEDDKEPETDNE